MCFVVQNHLGKGARCAPPLHPPGRGSVRGLTPSRASRTYRRSITRGRLRSPCTHRSFQEDQGLSRPLKPTRTIWPLHHQSGERSCSPDTPMRTSSRPLHGDDFIETKGREHSRYPSLEPSHRLGDALPQDPRPTLRGLDAAIASALNPIRSVAPPLNPLANGHARRRHTTVFRPLGTWHLLTPAGCGYRSDKACASGTWLLCLPKNIRGAQ